MDNINELVDKYYPLYIDKLKKGEYYYIPPLITIEDIAKKRYKENVQIEIYNSVKYTLEDLKTKEFFKVLCERELNDAIENKLDLEERLKYNIQQNIFIENNIYRTADMEILIRYPEIIITNSRKEKHTIKDLFIKLNFNSSGNLQRSFTMGRTTYNYTELISLYKHSHHRSISLNRNSLSEFNITCLGTGPLVGIIDTLRINFDEVLIMSLFANIDAYVGWESIEGVPYRYIKNISREGIRLKHITEYYKGPLEGGNLFGSIYKCLLDNINIVIKNSKLIRTIDNNLNPSYKIIYNEEKILKLFNDILLNKYTLEYLKPFSYIYEIDEFGKYKYYEESISNNNQDKVKAIKEINTELPVFTFNNEKIYLKLINDIEMKDASQKFIISPYYLKILINVVELKINNQSKKISFHESKL